jgi:hypothetical protein
MVRLLARVIGIGIETADMLVREILSRRLRDRRAGWDGLGQPPAEGTPSPGPKRRVSSRAQDQSERLKPEYDLSKASGEASIGFPSDDDELKRRLVICHGCGTEGTERVTNRSVSVPRNWESD